MSFTKLFENCAFNVPYQEAGDHVNYAFVEDGRTLYIYFQGSQGDVDWRRNFSFWKHPYKDMKNPYLVHSGFMTAWKEVEDIVIEKITECSAVMSMEYRWDKIIVIGYSHGGALAAFCHECVWYHRPDIREKCWGIGFEAPRIYAGLRFRTELRSRWNNFRVFRNRQDLVTHVPPRCFGFWHVGSLVKIGGKWHPWAALKGCFKALFSRDWKKAADCAKEVICILPHYQHEMVASLTEFDATEEGQALATEMGITREDA